MLAAFNMVQYGSKNISKLIRDFASDDPHLNDYAWDDFTSSNLKNLMKYLYKS